MPDNFIPSAAEYIRILPEIILSIIATLIMVMEGCGIRIAPDRSLAPAFLCSV